MKHKKDALSENFLKTTIYLDKDFKNIETASVYKVTAPDGHVGMFRQNITKESQDMKMWEHCECQIEKLEETREVSGAKINRVKLKQIDLRVLVYSCKGKAKAADLYFNKVKPGLKERGYIIVGHKCEPYIHKKATNNCHDGTILDKKYK